MLIIGNIDIYRIYLAKYACLKIYFLNAVYKKLENAYKSKNN
jgi:hypothetical protein